jgi:hypothetical protein
MNDKVLTMIVVISAAIAIYRVISTILIQHGVEHGMTEHEAQKRYDSLFSLLLTRCREKKEKRTRDMPDLSKNEPKTVQRVQTRWTTIGTNVRKER